MACVRKRYYKMPIGPDGKRHRVWHEMPGDKFFEIILKDYPINGSLVFRESPILCKIKVMK
jgi:hypothetical protein